MVSKLQLFLIKCNFITRVGFPYLSLFVWMLPLLLFGIDNNSLMAHDEGLYAWRSRLMFDSGDWINPWSHPHHKTPGFYWLIAVFYNSFGINEVVVRLPNMICGILSLFLVYEIGKILLNKRLAWLAGGILSVEFFWLQYSRLGTPDVPMVCLVLLGILSLLKAELNPKSRYIWGLIAGFCFSLGFLLRSFMIFLPMIALFPYLILHHRRHNHLFNPMLYVGFFLGLLPTIIWLRLSSLRFGDGSFLQLTNFVVQQGSRERVNNNWLYYFWNVPILAFPWSIFSLFGTGVLISNFLYHLKDRNRGEIHQDSQELITESSVRDIQKNLIENNSEHLSYTIEKEKDNSKFSRDISILVGFPFILFTELSIFSTRLSHYAICLYPFIALLAAVGLNYLAKLWNKQREKLKQPKNNLFRFRFSLLAIINYGFGTLGILLLLAGIIILFTSDRDGQIRNYAMIGLVLGLGWSTLPLAWIARCRFGKKFISAGHWIGIWLISSWLTLAVVGSQGFFSNYNPDFQAFLKQPEINQILQNNQINFVSVRGKTQVLINFYTPNHGKKVDEISQLTPPTYAWIGKKQASEITQSYQLIGEVKKHLLIYLK